MQFVLRKIDKVKKYSHEKVHLCHTGSGEYCQVLCRFCDPCVEIFWCRQKSDKTLSLTDAHKKKKSMCV
jgi:hypothetical protein